MRAAVPHMKTEFPIRVAWNSHSEASEYEIASIERYCLPLWFVLHLFFGFRGVLVGGKPPQEIAFMMIHKRACLLVPALTTRASGFWRLGSTAALHRMCFERQKYLPLARCFLLLLYRSQVCRVLAHLPLRLLRLEHAATQAALRVMSLNLRHGIMTLPM